MSLMDFLFGEDISQYTNSGDVTTGVKSYDDLMKNWDPSYMAAGTQIKPNAQLYGLVINDWDNSFKNRNVKITTEELNIPFQYLKEIPEWTKNANYQEMGSDIIGRFEPYSVYQSSSAIEFNLELTYIAECKTDLEQKSYWSLERIDKIKKKFQSLVYPTYSNGYAPPNKLLLNIGNIYKQFPIIIKIVSIKNEGPFDIMTSMPIMVNISLACRSSYPSWQAQSADKIFLGELGAGVFAYEELSNKTIKPKVKL